MTKQEKKERARVEAIVDEAAALLGMNSEYELTYIYDAGASGDDSIADEGYCALSAVTAVTTAHWQYKRARIRWYLQMTAMQTDNRLFATAVHELVHLLLNPLDSLLDTAADPVYAAMNEYTCETITRAIMFAAGREMQ